MFLSSSHKLILGFFWTSTVLCAAIQNTTTGAFGMGSHDTPNQDEYIDLLDDWKAGYKQFFDLDPAHKKGYDLLRPIWMPYQPISRYDPFPDHLRPLRLEFFHKKTKEIVYYVTNPDESWGKVMETISKKPFYYTAFENFEEVKFHFSEAKRRLPAGPLRDQITSVTLARFRPTFGVWSKTGRFQLYYNFFCKTALGEKTNWVVGQDGTVAQRWLFNPNELDNSTWVDDQMV